MSPFTDITQRDALIELRNGRFLDVEKGVYFAPGTRLRLKGGTIDAVIGPEQDLNGSPPGIEVDLKGRTVIPALFNTHAHIQLTLPSIVARFTDLRLNSKWGPRQVEKSMADCLERGITHVRDALTEDLRLNRLLKSRIENKEIPGPRIYQSILVGPLGGPFSPKRGLKDRLLFTSIGMSFVSYESADSGIVTFPPDAGESILRGAVDRAVDERGADYIKLYDQKERVVSYEPGAVTMNTGQIRIIADQAHHRGRSVTMHHLTAESFAKGVDAAIPSLAHLPYDRRVDAHDVDKCLKSGVILEPTLSLGFFLCWRKPGTLCHPPRMACLDAIREDRYRALADEFWIPELRNAFIDGIEKVRRGKRRLMGIMDMSHVFRYYGGIVSQGVDNLRILVEHGIPLGCGNDAGAVPCSPAMVGLELKLLSALINADGGEPVFNNADAIRAATINSARAMGLSDRFGSIAAGKTADLAILDGDPLADLDIIGQPVAGLFMEGRLVIDRLSPAKVNDFRDRRSGAE